MIPWHENIPLLSFALLRGRCRGCGAAISWRYPLVEALTGGLFLLAAWTLVDPLHGGWRDPSRWLHLGAGLLFLAALVALTFIDLAHRILPDRITKPGMAAGAVLSALLPGLQPGHERIALPPPGAAFLLSLAGILVGYGSLWLVAWAGEKAFRREAMGMGDAKLLAMVGAFTGPLGALLAAVVGFALGLVGGLLHRLSTRDPEFPFGPALAVGGAAVFLDRRDIGFALRQGSDALSDPLGGLIAAVVSGAVLFAIRGRLPRPILLVLSLLVALLAAVNLLLFLWPVC
jgi:leader peptidase (prepilin peptidase)/N-methyltransferase